MEVTRYDIALNIDFERSSFSGVEQISLEGSPDSLELDSVGLEISSITAVGGDCKWKYFKEEGKISVTGKAMEALRVEFSGNASEGGLHGFYKSNYKGGYFLSTQFEPSGARHLFPCIDHPSFKAVFGIKLDVPEGMGAISNMPLSGKSSKGGRDTLTFEDTPRMSTYLLFIGVGDFAEQRMHGGIEIIAATSPEQSGKGAFAIENSRRILDEYENFYSIKFPLRKLHLVGIPEFAAGAMENWGAITFREVALLVDDSTSLANKKLIVTVIAHEIAHQWFGNLVTMKWWNDLWLNESFATYMSTVVVDRMYPGWETWSDFLTSETNGAMVGDSLVNTHPVEVEVRKPDEINQIFDEISYGKGASVLRMVASFIGEESFREGVNAYLRKFSYGNAMSSDLWNSLELSSSEPVADIMKHWIGMPGFPVVNAAYRDGEVKISQERFLLNGHDSSPPWPIPLNYTVNGVGGRLLIKTGTASIKADGVSQINLNSGQTGFYRVMYDERLYNIIAGNLAKMDSLERWGILSDIFYFLLAGRTELQHYLRFVRLLAGDDRYVIVSGIASQLNTLRELLPENAEVHRVFTDYYRTHLNRIGVDRKEGEDENNAVLRERLTERLSVYDDAFAEEHSTRFENIREQIPELHGSIGIAYARSKGVPAFDPLVNWMKNAGSDADAIKALLALSSFKDPGLVTKTLDLAISGEVNAGNIFYSVMACATNPQGKNAVWEWFRKNNSSLLDIYAGTGISSHIVEFIAARAGIESPDEIRDFFGSTVLPGTERGAAKGLELLEAYLRLRKNYGK